MFFRIGDNSPCKPMLLAVIIFAISMNAYAASGKCYRSTITDPVPFNGNGGEIIMLDDGSTWEESSYQYLYLYEYNPSVIICPSEGKMYLDDNVFFVIPQQQCYKTTIQEPTPFNGNGGEIITLADGTIWKESSYQYLYLYEYNPTVLVCPGIGKMTLGGYTFNIIQFREK